MIKYLSKILFKRDNPLYWLLLFKKAKETLFNYIDYTTAYIKNILPTAKGKAKLDILGGRTIKFKQLYDTYDTSAIVQGITYTRRNDKSWLLTGTPTGRSNKAVGDRIKAPCVFGHKYFLKGCAFGGSPSTYYLTLVGYTSTSQYTEFDINKSDFGNGVIVSPTNPNTTLWQIEIVGSQQAYPTSVGELVFKPQLYDITDMGLEDLSISELNDILSNYYPYNKGSLVNADVESVMSKGANLCKEIIDNVNSYGGTTTSTKVVSAIGYYGCLIEIVGGNIYSITRENTSNRFRAYYFTNNPIENTDETSINGVINDNGTSLVANTPSSARYIFIAIGTTKDNIMVNLGSTPLPYTPYREPIVYPTSSIIQKYFPTGMKSAGSVFDEIDIDRGVASAIVSSLDLGNVAFSQSSTHIFIAFNVGTPLKKKGTTNLLTSVYATQNTYWGDLPNNSICGDVNTDGFIAIRDDNISSVADLHNKLNGIMMYYESATPTETPLDNADIEALRSLQVEAGGTLEFHQEDYHIPVPSKIEYKVTEEPVAMMLLSEDGPEEVEEPIEELEEQPIEEEGDE